MNEQEKRGKEIRDIIWLKIQEHKKKNRSRDNLKYVLLDHLSWECLRKYCYEYNESLLEQFRYSAHIFGLRIFLPERHFPASDENNPIIEVF